MKLKGRTAIVTGGAGGIGRGIALLFGKEGANVSIWDINLDGAQGVADELRAMGTTKALAIGSDISKESDVNDAVKKVTKEFGRIDILVNNAAFLDLPMTFFHETEPSKWEPEITITFKGVLYCCKAVIPGMIQQHYGRIVNITSTAAIVGMPRFGVYSACKGAVAAFSRSIAAELGSHGIVVNCIAPAGIRHESLLEKQKSRPAQRRGYSDSVMPVGRVGVPDDIANMALFLASEESSYVTGHHFAVDGGSSTVELRNGPHYW